MKWIDNLINSYYDFIKDNTKITTNDPSGWVEISTPFIGLFNDGIDIYVKKENDKIILSDDGNTLRNLELSGVTIHRSIKRKEILDTILLTHGTKINTAEEIIIEATEKNFPQKKLNLINTIVEISDMSYLANTTVSSVFKEDVQEYLDEQEIIYTPHFISKGNTGLEFTFDFQIASKTTEIVIKSFNSISKLNLPHFLFTWNDIKKVRENQTKKKIIGMAIINDTDKETDNDFINALHTEEAQHILWSQRYKPESINKLKLTA